MTVQELADRLVTLCNEGKGTWPVKIPSTEVGLFWTDCDLYVEPSGAVEIGFAESEDL